MNASEKSPPGYGGRNRPLVAALGGGRPRYLADEPAEWHHGIDKRLAPSGDQPLSLGSRFARIRKVWAKFLIQRPDRRGDLGAGSQPSEAIWSRRRVGKQRRDVSLDNADVLYRLLDDGLRNGFFIPTGVLLGVFLRLRYRSENSAGDHDKAKLVHRANNIPLAVEFHPGRRAVAIIPPSWERRLGSTNEVRMIASFNARLGAKQYGGDVAIRSPVLRRVASRIRTRLDRVQDGWPVHSAEVRDEGDQLRVEFLVPGYSIENLRLVVEDQVLHLIATRPGVEGGAQDRELHVIARLPRPVEANLVAAELEAGVLTVTAPTRSGFRVPIQPRPTTTPASDGPGAAR